MRVLTFYPIESLKLLMRYLFKKANKLHRKEGRKEIPIGKAIVVEGAVRLHFRVCDSTREGQIVCELKNRWSQHVWPGRP